MLGTFFVSKQIAISSFEATWRANIIFLTLLAETQRPFESRRDWDVQLLTSFPNIVLL